MGGFLATHDPAHGQENRSAVALPTDPLSHRHECAGMDQPFTEPPEQIKKEPGERGSGGGREGAPPARGRGLQKKNKRVRGPPASENFMPLIRKKSSIVEVQNPTGPNKPPNTRT